jgi:hypothetical protein
MKRCSQCEFTFEDHLQFCDFDGTKLSVVPEPVPSFNKFSRPPGVSASLFLRVVRSRVSLAVMALAGVMLSALVVGHYDSGAQSNIEPDIDLASNVESRNDMVNLVPQGASETLDQAEPEQVSKPTFISTERRIKAEEKTSSLPSSTISRLSVASRSRVLSSTSKPEGTKRRVEKANRESLARNSKRPAGRESYDSRQQKDSKVIAILKKTGNILTRPFKF